MAVWTLGPSCKRTGQSSDGSGGSIGLREDGQALYKECVIHGYENQMTADSPRGDGDIIYVWYELGPVFPARDFIAAVKAHVAHLEWKELQHSPLSYPPRRLSDEWGSSPPDGNFDRTYEAWWERDGAWMTLLVMGRTGSDHVRGQITHYSRTRAGHLLSQGERALRGVRRESTRERPTNQERP